MRIYEIIKEKKFIILFSENKLSQNVIELKMYGFNKFKIKNKDL